MIKRTQKQKGLPRLRCSNPETAMPVVQAGIASGAKMKVERQPQNDSKSNGLTHEEAQRRLEEVRNRYGIHLAHPKADPIAESRSSSHKEPAEPKPEPRLAPPVAGTRPKPADLKQPGRPLTRADAKFSTEPRSDGESFHYLVRIAECTSVLHCEVKADHAAAARDHVKRIPNLMEWREISFAELLELAKNCT
jgi:hypothetical protein